MKPKRHQVTRVAPCPFFFSKDQALRALVGAFGLASFGLDMF